MGDRVQHIYIDGQRREIVGGLDPNNLDTDHCGWAEIYVDHPDLPGRRCARHWIPAGFAAGAASRQAWRSSGHTYNF